MPNTDDNSADETDFGAAKSARPRLRYDAHTEDARGRLSPLEPEVFSVAGFLDATNLVLNNLLGRVAIRGEVAEFKINQNKWVFFNLKDLGQEEPDPRAFAARDKTISCFIPKYRLNTAIEDGMKVQVIGTAKVTDRGKFSFTVEAVVPLGQGSIKKSFELLKAQLAKEGLFDPARKRRLPRPVQKIGVISSTAAAGYADFIKILNERWGGLKVLTAHTQVQGLPAVPQIVAALEYFNAHTDVDVIALIRGGGSADDLAIFNDERIVRAIVASQIPVITGIGHEVDESLADLAADVRASTPSNAAQLLTPDKRQLWDNLSLKLSAMRQELEGTLAREADDVATTRNNIEYLLRSRLERVAEQLAHRRVALQALDPALVLAKGYAMVTGQLAPGATITVRTRDCTAEAEVKRVTPLAAAGAQTDTTQKPSTKQGKE